MIVCDLWCLWCFGCFYDFLSEIPEHTNKCYCIALYFMRARGGIYGVCRKIWRDRRRMNCWYEDRCNCVGAELIEILWVQEVVFLDCVKLN